MARAEVGTPKWLSNKMKSKGLQRLRWYCQMCEKQCRDENGFKCHMMSENHARQMQVFAQRPGKYMDEFSRTFEADFMRFMRTRYCRTRVLANTVYCELISNKHHTHMNSTIWVTLSEFVRYLDTTGKCKVEQTPRGFYLTFIDKEKEARDAQAKNDLKLAASAESLEERRIQDAIKSLQTTTTTTVRPQDHELHRSTSNEPTGLVKIALKTSSSTSKPIQQISPPSSSSDKPIKKISSDLFNAPPVDDLLNPTNKTRQTTRLEELVSRKKARPELGNTITSSGSSGSVVEKDKSSSNDDEEEEVVDSEDMSADETGEQQIFPPHPLENEDNWMSRGLRVRVTKKDWEWFDVIGVIYKLEKPNGPAIVKLSKSISIDEGEVDLNPSNDIVNDNDIDGLEKIGRIGGKNTSDNNDQQIQQQQVQKKQTLLRLGSRYLETVVPKDLGRWVRVCLGSYRGHEGRLIRDNSDSETIDLLLYYGPAWGDVPYDIDLIEDESIRKEYKERLNKAKIDGTLWGRGELPLNGIPYDAIAQCKPPTSDYIEFDQVLHPTDENSDDDNNNDE